MKLTKLLLSLLILTLPLIHGRVLVTLGIDFSLIVSGNFEFTKSLYFNIFSSLILIVFFIEYILIGGNRVLLGLREKYILISIYAILSISTYFSLSPFMSLIGDLEKGHTFFLVSNLLGLYIVMRQIVYSQRNFLIQIFILSGVLSCVLAIKELYYPSFNYGALGERALGSFGHPNYLSGFLLLLLPLLFSIPFPFAKDKGKKEQSDYLEVEARQRFQVWIRIFITLLFLTTIILCKSLIAIFLAAMYIYYVSEIGKRYITKTYFAVFVIISTLVSLSVITLYFPEKLHSLISRWYLWETTLRIIFSDMKVFTLGAGLETLPYYFNSYKVPEIYIFENFGYSADRPHNFFLNIFYHFGIFGVSIFLYLIYLLYKYKNSYPSEYKILSISTVVLFLFYGVFHYFSASSYLALIFAVSLFWHKAHKNESGVIILLSIILVTNILGALLSARLYHSEIYYSKGEYESALETYAHPRYLLKFGETEKAENTEGIISQRNYKTRIILTDNKELGCDNLLATYPSAENYFYCGNILESNGDITLSKSYYNKGLSLLPDLWNEESVYWDNYFVKKTITGNRFFSEKFGDINSVLEKVEK